MNTLCLNRISKDLKEINKSPLEGIGIISLDNDPKKYIVNIKIMSGIFKGYCIQLLLTFPEQYPIKPPRILIYPGQCFDNTYHHHIFRSDIKDDKDQYFNKFCFDLLDNDFLPTSSEAYTGWNPSYTISTLLLQVQTFLTNPDFPTGYIPNKQKIDELMKSMDNYEKSFIIKNDNNEDIIKIHTWKNPYPEMYFKNNSNLKNINNNMHNDIIENKENNKLKTIKENLTCFISRLNYIDNKDIILGYPIKKLKNGAFIPIPEILSYDCFIEESSKNNNNNSNDGLLNNEFLIDRDEPMTINAILNPGFTFRVNRGITLNNFFIGINRNTNNRVNFGPSFKSANNELYNSWLPIYINDENFGKNKTTILNYFSILKYGDNGLQKFDFQPIHIFEVMPIILSEMIVKIMDQNVSSSFLICFFQYALMFKKLEKKYNNIFIDYQKSYLPNKINNIWKSQENISPKKELLELLILFYFCDNEIDKEMKELIKIYIRNLKNVTLIKLLNYFKPFQFISEKLTSEDLNIHSLFDFLLNLIFKNREKSFSEKEKVVFLCTNIIKEKIKKEITQRFIKGLLELLGDLTDTSLINKKDFSEYIDIKTLYSFVNHKFDSFNIRNESYKLISIFEILKDKLLNKNFIQNLENNFGIYLDNENFIAIIKDIKKGAFLDGLDILENYDFFSIMDLITLNSIEKRSNFDFSRFVEIYPFYSENHLVINLIQDLMEEERKKPYLKKQEKKKKSKEIKMIDFQKVKGKRIIIKNSYDKKYNKRFDKYINKKNITRLILFKRNYY